MSSDLPHTDNSLTAPWDRKGDNPNPQSNNQPLSDDHVDKLVTEQLDKFNITVPLRKDRLYCDVDIPGQRFVLVSFVPTVNAKPDDKGVYGFMKVRGSYETEKDAVERAKYIVKNIDSYNTIKVAYVGRPFPLTCDAKFSKQVDEVKLDEMAEDAIKEDIKSKMRDEKKKKEEIEARQKNLQVEIDNESKSPIENYTMLRFKVANLMTYKDTVEKKLEEIKNNIEKGISEVKAMDIEYPEFKDEYRDRYNNARKELNIPDTPESNEVLSYFNNMDLF